MSPSTPRTFLSGEADPRCLGSPTFASISIANNSRDDDGEVLLNDNNATQNSKKLIQIIDESTTSPSTSDKITQEKNKNDVDDGSYDGPPPLFDDCSTNQSVKTSAKRNDDCKEKDIEKEKNDESNNELSLMEQMMREAIKSKEEKKVERREKLKKEMKKTSFGMKKGFLNASSKNRKSSSSRQNEKKKNSSGIGSSKSSISQNGTKRMTEDDGYQVPDMIYELDESGNMLPTNTVNKEDETVPTIRPKYQNNHKNEKNMKNPLQFREVQDAMKTSDTSNFFNYLSNKEQEWNTPSLLDQISNNKILSSGMMNPKFTSALEAFKSNPKSAMKQFQNHPDVIEFLNEFCRVMGNHFTELGEKQEAEKMRVQNQKKADWSVHNNDDSLGPMAKQALRKEKERKMKGEESWDRNLSDDEKHRLDSIMADKELTSLLMDVDLQKVMNECSTQPGRMRMYMQHKDYGPKLKKLVHAGLLKVV